MYVYMYVYMYVCVELVINVQPLWTYYVVIFEGQVK